MKTSLPPEEDKVPFVGPPIPIGSPTKPGAEKTAASGKPDTVRTTLSYDCNAGSDNEVDKSLGSDRVKKVDKFI